MGTLTIRNDGFDELITIQSLPIPIRVKVLLPLNKRLKIRRSRDPNPIRSCIWKFATSLGMQLCLLSDDLVKWGENLNTCLLRMCLRVPFRYLPVSTSYKLFINAKHEQCSIRGTGDGRWELLLCFSTPNCDAHNLIKSC